MSGIDKEFDYSVPASLSDRAIVGAAVRVVLNNRKVAGWIVARSDDPDHAFDSFDRSRLTPLSAVSGNGVAPELIPVARWTARHYGGSLRAVLKSATAPRMRDVASRPQYSLRGSTPSMPGDAVIGSGRTAELLMAPPTSSVLPLVIDAVRHGSVLVLCPTVRMVRLGAAWLRKHKCTVAEYPGEWARAAGGVDVVIGTRSAVWAPCPSLSTIVVIDEHDEAFAEERVPTWNAREVAGHRALLAGARVLCTSGVPSLAALTRMPMATSFHVETDVWPTIEVVDMNNDDAVGGVFSSLLSSPLLSAVRGESSVAVVINTKMRARRLACKSCRTLQTCRECSSMLVHDNAKTLVCMRCDAEHGSVCVSCGRTTLSVLRPGVAHLAEEISASCGKQVVQVTAESEIPVNANGRVYVGTEALLHRLQNVDTVVFADFDLEVSSPRLATAESAWALLSRAARTVGRSGRVVVQTRQVMHPVLASMAATSRSDGTPYLSWAERELSVRRSLGLPPIACAAHVETPDPAGVSCPPGARMARLSDRVLVTTDTHEALLAAIAEIRHSSSDRVRVVIDPVRV